jgi:hypothetical protein
LTLPDGEPVRGGLATWLAFDASWLRLLRPGKARPPRWNLAPAEELALDPARGYPVLAYEKEELWVRDESFADFVFGQFAPAPVVAAAPAAKAAKVGRLAELPSDRLVALDASPRRST